MITSATNVRIKEARKLQRRRNRYAARRLLIEGVRLVGDAVAAGIRPEVVYFAPELLGEGSLGHKLVAQLQQAGVETVACSAGVFAGLAETVTPQGIAAIVAMPDLNIPATPTLTLVVDRVREPGNAGTLLRSAEAAGVELAIFAPDTVDPFNDKALRAGMGAHFRLPVHVAGDWETVLAHLRAGGSDGVGRQQGDGHAMAIYMADATASLAYDEVDWRQPVALIVGGEAEGASATAASVAERIAIPMLGGTESLNAAMAGSIILFEAARQRRQSLRGR
jgi:RNA methyltransferase, TrmH family